MEEPGDVVSMIGLGRQRRMMADIRDGENRCWDASHFERAHGSMNLACTFAVNQ